MALSAVNVIVSETSLTPAVPVANAVVRTFFFDHLLRCARVDAALTLLCRGADAASAAGGGGGEEDEASSSARRRRRRSLTTSTPVPRQRRHCAVRPAVGSRRLRSRRDRNHSPLPPHFRQGGGAVVEDAVERILTIFIGKI